MKVFFFLLAECSILPFLLEALVADEAEWPLSFLPVLATTLFWFWLCLTDIALLEIGVAFYDYDAEISL